MNIPLRYDLFNINVTLNESTFEDVQLMFKSSDHQFIWFINSPGIYKLTFTETLYGSVLSKILNITAIESNDIVNFLLHFYLHLNKIFS